MNTKVKHKELGTFYINGFDSPTVRIFTKGTSKRKTSFYVTYDLLSDLGKIIFNHILQCVMDNKSIISELDEWKAARLIYRHVYDEFIIDNIKKILL